MRKTSSHVSTVSRAYPRKVEGSPFAPWSWDHYVKSGFLIQSASCNVYFQSTCHVPLVCPFHFHHILLKILIISIINKLHLYIYIIFMYIHLSPYYGKRQYSRAHFTRTRAHTLTTDDKYKSQFMHISS